MKCVLSTMKICIFDNIKGSIQLYLTRLSHINWGFQIYTRKASGTMLCVIKNYSFVSVDAFLHSF